MNWYIYKISIKPFLIHPFPNYLIDFPRITKILSTLLYKHKIFIIIHYFSYLILPSFSSLFPSFIIMHTITQESFNEIVQENIDSFEMELEEAIQDALEQCKSQSIFLTSFSIDHHLRYRYKIINCWSKVDFSKGTRYSIIDQTIIWF